MLKYLAVMVLANSPFRLWPILWIILLSMGLILPVLSGSAQPAVISKTESKLESVLAAATSERTSYIEKFRDLLAEEEKTFRLFDREGRVRRSRIVQSTFVVFQYDEDDSAVAEFRNVLAVDGRPLRDADKRAATFFTELGQAKTSATKLDKIEKEGSRSDLEHSINGLTLFQAVALAGNLRPAFDFSFVEPKGDEPNGAYMVSYKQLRESRFILFADGDRRHSDELTLIFDLDDRELRKRSPRLAGIFWIDKHNYRILREKRQVFVDDVGITRGRLLAETDFEYKESEFGMNVPSIIKHTHFRVSSQRIPEAEIVFRYSSFSKPSVEVRSSEVKN